MVLRNCKDTLKYEGPDHKEKEALSNKTQFFARPLTQPGLFQEATLGYMYNTYTRHLQEYTEMTGNWSQPARQKEAYRNNCHLHNCPFLYPKATYTSSVRLT